MAANTSSIAEELMQSISLHQMRAIPAYLSENDSTTSWDFARSELAATYVLDTQNLYWPSTINRSHVFDLFAEFLPHRDSGKTRLDMINFVSENKERYMLDGHIVLKMHETNLNAWACKMTYWENSADELALYALSDLTKQHTIVITKTKPWSTVHPNVNVRDIHDLLNVCSVRLLFLGNNKFGRLRPRPPNYQTPFMTNLPVFPGNEPSDREWETAHSLLMMNPDGAVPTFSYNVPIELQQPLPTYTEPTTGELPDLTDKLDVEPSDYYTDAMEHIINHKLVDTDPLPSLKVPDATDSIRESTVFVETEANPNAAYVLVIPQVEQQLKTCFVKLTRIDSVLTYVPRRNLCATLMHDRKPHTRSMCTPKPPRRGRRPRIASQPVNYRDPDTTSDDEATNKKSRNKRKTKPEAAGPTSERVNSQINRTVHPSQRLLPIKSNTPVTSSADEENSDATELYTPESDQELSSTGTKKPKGAFKITVKGLKKVRYYNCKYCEKSFDSSKGLTVHHQKEHKKLYCKLCKKTFNNPTTYSRHLKTHSGKGHVCSDCNKIFAYASQLKTHLTVHLSKRHKCTRTNCTRSFKNLGDLTRHLNLHDAKVHQCTDCSYSHVDIRNFESHCRSHSRISKYTCKRCGQEFIFNVQYQRHVKKEKCKYKRSTSPDY